MVEPSGLVCPRCGNEAGEDDECRVCGLRLADLSELPTRAKWEQHLDPTNGPVETSLAQPAIEPTMRVCPECGAPAGVQPFCGNCGKNLTAIDRIPTREEWESARQARQSIEIAAVLQGLAALERVSARLFDFSVDDRSLTNSTVADVVKRELASSLEKNVNRGPASSSFAVEAREGEMAKVDGTENMTITCAVTLAEGARIEQEYFCELITGDLRADVVRSGAPRLLEADGRAVRPLTLPRPHELADSPVPVEPERVSAGTAMSASIPRREARAGIGGPMPSANKYVGGGAALLAAGLVLVGSFLPVHSFGAVPIPHNSYVSEGDWWVLIAAVLIGIAAAYSLADMASKRAWQIVVPALAAVGAGVYGLTHTFQTLSLTPEAQQLLGISSVRASVGVGVYLVLAGGAIALLGAGIIVGGSSAPRNQ